MTDNDTKGAPSYSAADRAQMREFGRRLAELMADRRISQSDLARSIWGSTTNSRGTLVARSRDRISHYVRGSQRPNHSTVVKIAQVLGTSVEGLYPSEDIHPATRSRGAGANIAVKTPDVRLTMVNGVSDSALLEATIMLPVSTAIQVLALLTQHKSGVQS